MSDQPSFSADQAPSQQPTSFQDNGSQGDGGEPQTQTLTPEQVAELVKRDTHAQNHIKTLENEARERKTALETLQSQLEEAQAKLGKQDTLEEALRKLEEAQRQQANNGDHTTVTPEEIAAQVEQRLKEQALAKTAEQNQAEAISAAKTRFGDGYLEQIKKTANELGMSLEAVDSLAAQSPESFRRLFIGATPDVRTERQPGQNHRAADNTDTNADTQRQLYRENRRSYWSADNFARVAEQVKQGK